LVGSLLVVTSLPRRHVPSAVRDLRPHDTAAQGRGSSDNGVVRRQTGGRDGQPRRA
jgi:hypothetical protein